MTVRVYRSTDASAPQLTGTAGSLIAVLSGCLVNGYGAQVSSGWTIAYSGTNLAAYRAPTGNRRYLYVSDISTIEGRIIGFEEMTSIAAGTGAFPTTSQLSGGLFFAKGAAGAVARPWMLIATDTCFYLIADGTVAAGLDLAANITFGQSFMFFGDFISNRPSDAYNTALIVNRVGTGTAAAGSAGTIIQTTYTGITGHYMARPYTQIGTSTLFGKSHRGAICAGLTIGRDGGDFPDPMTGNMNLSYIDIWEQTGGSAAQVSRRGRLPGIWAPLHTLPAASGDVFAGSGDLAGKTFTMINLFNGGTSGRTAFEISDTW